MEHPAVVAGVAVAVYLSTEPQAQLESLLAKNPVTSVPELPASTIEGPLSSGYFPLSADKFWTDKWWSQFFFLAVSRVYLKTRWMFLAILLGG